MHEAMLFDLSGLRCARMRAIGSPKIEWQKGAHGPQSLL